MAGHYPHPDVGDDVRGYQVAHKDAEGVAKGPRVVEHIQHSIAACQAVCTRVLQGVDHQRCVEHLGPGQKLPQDGDGAVIHALVAPEVLVAELCDGNALKGVEQGTEVAQLSDAIQLHRRKGDEVVGHQQLQRRPAD